MLESYSPVIYHILTCEPKGRRVDNGKVQPGTFRLIFALLKIC